MGFFRAAHRWGDKVYFVIYSVFGVTSKILSYYSNYIVDVVMWAKFGNSSICTREVIITSIFKMIWPEKTLFLRSGLGSSSIIWNGRHQVQTWNFTPVRQKSCNSYVNSYVCRSYRRKTGRVVCGAGGGGLCALPRFSWIGLKLLCWYQPWVWAVSEFNLQFPEMNPCWGLSLCSWIIRKEILRNKLP